MFSKRAGHGLDGLPAGVHRGSMTRCCGAQEPMLRDVDAAVLARRLDAVCADQCQLNLAMISTCFDAGLILCSVAAVHAGQTRPHRAYLQVGRLYSGAEPRRLPAGLVCACPTCGLLRTPVAVVCHRKRWYVTQLLSNDALKASWWWLGMQAVCLLVCESPSAACSLSVQQHCTSGATPTRPCSADPACPAAHSPAHTQSCCVHAQDGDRLQEAMAPTVLERLRQNSAWHNSKGGAAGYCQTGTLLQPCLGLLCK